MRRLRFLFAPLGVLLLYGGTLGHGFVWDDPYLSLLRVYSSFDVPAVFTGPGNGFEYLPVRDLSLMLDHALYGSEPAGFHATNVLLFAAACVLLHHLYERLLGAAPRTRVATRARGLALAAVLVFAAHPLQVEPVAFVTARNALLALLFVLATLLAYARFLGSGGRGAYLSSLVLAAAALLSKATAVCLPLLVLLLDLYLARGTLRAASRRVVPHALLAAGAAIVHALVASGTGVIGDAVTLQSVVERLPRALFVPEFYAAKFLWPIPLTTEYEASRWLEQPFLLGAGALLLWGSLGVLLVRGWRQRSLGWLLALGYLAAVLPVTNLLPTHPFVADRYAQLTLVWLVPLVVVLPGAWLPRSPGRVLAALLIAGLAVLSFRQVFVWHSDETLFAHAVEVGPAAKDSLANLGMTLWEAGRREEGMDAFRRLTELEPDDFHLPFAMGWQALDAGNDQAAEHWLRVATRMRGNKLYLAWIKLAELHARRREWAEARAAYERAIALARTQPDGGPVIEYVRGELRHLEVYSPSS